MGTEILSGKIIKYDDDAETYSVPEGVTEIGDLAFAGAKNLRKVELPETVDSIGNYAFAGCDALQEIRLPERVSNMGTGVFQNCWKLREIHFPEGLKILGGEMLESCHTLRKVYLPDSLEQIERTAFNTCRNLREVHIDPQRMDILPAALHNIAVLTYMSSHTGCGPCGIVDEYARGKQRLLIDLAVNRRDTGAVRYMLEHGLADADTVRKYMEKSAAAGRVEITALLLDYSRSTSAEEDPVLSGDPFR